ncbi:hypothetical protein AVEN_86735-1 [Araneus ventricosus]|uniref:Uncharacterized protein n=1 Tax=Araneus ventricosus TaxID=182803 RepID=A0A4Y2JGW1_ARAVE|nr:hypothetical protein AVEN_86735-1 [Araneus ventricosus]
MSTFYGNSSKWLDFWNRFECIIHNNGNLSETEIFTYLKSLLSGNALAAISGFVIIYRNYDSSIEILKARFGRHDIVISSHMNKLLSIAPVRNISNVKALRNCWLALCFGQRKLGIFCSDKHLSCKKCSGKPHHESICLNPKMPINSENPEKKERAVVPQNSCDTTGSDVKLQTVYAVGNVKERIGF